LENILVARALTSEHQMELIYELAARFAQEKGIFKLLVNPPQKKEKIIL